MTVYGSLVYLLFLATLLYSIGWVEGLVVPRTIDSGHEASTAVAIVIDLALLSVFAVQHSVMARPAFKRRWTRVIPPPMERSTYVLCATAALALVMWQWRPLTGIVWEVDATPARIAIYTLSLAGWALALIATLAIDHLDLFGLRQVFRYRAGKSPSPIDFRTPTLYRMVRHPLYLGFLIAFWAAPTMTDGRLLFAAVVTGYVLVAVRFEEHDLVTAFGDRYRQYRRQVPMLVPHPRRRS
ncbi:isoprenylcysteine carboxylmethyltransferase family protein [Skermania sp. ID1734]|uniref:methanethiol S-methyltransferase n=1 Tax=Skermania sp. ID1734 TaxID=2597516 RepID=UPI00117FE689|nr:methanethiol S-methyltransferase [Skermania sp. ID1734]TSE01705.1 isoprenylcysteine carboxylmethyltransferase family protein [Skermania sp. ID1734]